MTLQEKISVLIFLLLIALVCGLEVSLLARYAVGRFRDRASQGILTTKPAIFLHVLVGVGVICLLYGYFVEPYWIEVNAITVRTAKLDRARFRIVQISDLHCDKKPRNEQRIVRIVNGLEPDVIVATGDYLNAASALPRLTETLGSLKAPLGKFAVNGNFEIGRWPDLDVLEGTGFRLLERDTVIVAKGRDKIGISGLGLDRADACRERLGDLPADRFDIFLFHTPDLVEEVSGLGVDLYLCGHTHGGQVALPLYGALLTFSKFGKKYESGLYQVGGMTAYVNRGLGLEPSPAPQVRFFARPEIAVFDILPDQK